MNVYIHDADIYCEDCGEAICEFLKGSDFAPTDPDDETSYDSSEFPKGPYPDGGGEADCPQHCGSGKDCFNAIELSDGHKIGAWLENPLTIDGLGYVREAIQGGGEVAALWAEWYADCLDEESPCENCMAGACNGCIHDEATL